MIPRYPALFVPALMAIFACSAGGDGDQPATGAANDGKPDSLSTAQPFENFDAARFENPTVIDNPWLPMKPGTRLVYEGKSVEDDGAMVPHRVVINVTDLTKVVGGVRSVVSWDLDYADGELVEAELAFFAQDTAGNVWRMGEYPE